MVLVHGGESHRIRIRKTSPVTKQKQIQVKEPYDV